MRGSDFRYKALYPSPQPSLRERGPGRDSAEIVHHVPVVGSIEDLNRTLLPEGRL